MRDFLGFFEFFLLFLRDSFKVRAVEVLRHRVAVYLLGNHDRLRNFLFLRFCEVKSLDFRGNERFFLQFLLFFS